MPILRVGRTATGAVVSTMLAAFTSPAAAQRPDTVVAAGAEVRMWSDRMQWNAREGSVVRWLNQDTVIVNVRQLEEGFVRSSRYIFPVWDLDTLQMRTPRRFDASRYERSAVTGSVFGVAVGVIMGIVGVASVDCPTSADPACGAAGYAKGAARSGLVGGLVGIGAGLLISAYGTLRGEDGWVTIDFQRPSG